MKCAQVREAKHEMKARVGLSTDFGLWYLIDMQWNDTECKISNSSTRLPGKKDLYSTFLSPT